MVRTRAIPMILVVLAACITTFLVLWFSSQPFHLDELYGFLD